MSPKLARELRENFQAHIVFVQSLPLSALKDRAWWTFLITSEPLIWILLLSPVGGDYKGVGAHAISHVCFTTIIIIIIIIITIFLESRYNSFLVISRCLQQTNPRNLPKHMRPLPQRPSSRPKMKSPPDVLWTGQARKPNHFHAAVTCIQSSSQVGNGLDRLDGGHFFAVVDYLLPCLGDDIESGSTYEVVLIPARFI